MLKAFDTLIKVVSSAYLINSKKSDALEKSRP